MEKPAALFFHFDKKKIQLEYDLVSYLQTQRLKFTT